MKKKSFTSVSKQGHLIVTELSKTILIQGIGHMDEDGGSRLSHFKITKENAGNLVKHINAILKGE